MQAAIDATQSQQFMTNVKSKLIVVYRDEEGLDTGGVRRDFFSHFFHQVESIIIDNRSYMEASSKNLLGQMEFAAGVFAAIAVLQDEIYHPAIVELLKVAGPRYLEGLNLFDELGDFLSTNSSLHINFKRESVTPDHLISLFRRESNPNSAMDVIEKINFNFVCKFFREVFGKTNFLFLTYKN